jgi:hypothetical protein
MITVIIPILNAMPYLPEALAFGAVRRWRKTDGGKLMADGPVKFALI